MSADMKQLQQKLNISFKNRQLLKQAFTHASYVNEHRFGHHQDNERLEFLGDAVLELTVSEFLFERCPTRPEGELTKMRASIVCEPSLVNFANHLQFGQYVLLGKGEELTGGRTRPALLADVFESFIGALYLDQGLDTVREFLQRFVFPQITLDGKLQTNDYKTQLQELEAERLMILMLLLADQPDGIGLLIAAKSILRFNELARDASDRRASEYVIIGTLASFAWAIATAWATGAALRALAP